MSKQRDVSLVGTIIMKFGFGYSSITMMRSSLILRYLKKLAPEFSIITHYRMIQRFREEKTHLLAFWVEAPKNFRQQGRPEYRYFYDRRYMDDIDSSEYKKRYWKPYWINYPVNRCYRNKRHLPMCILEREKKDIFNVTGTRRQEQKSIILYLSPAEPAIQ